MYWTRHVKGGPQKVNHAAVIMGNILYSFGGYSEWDDFTEADRPIDIFTLNTTTYRWVRLDFRVDANTPFHRFGHTVVAHGGFFYLWGGGNDEHACNVLYRFNPRTLLWDRPPVTGNIPLARDGHTAVVVGRNKIVIFGGFVDDVELCSQDVHSLDLNTFRWTCILPKNGIAPLPRRFHTATVHQDRYMFVFGGWVCEDLLMNIPEMYPDDLHCFDIEKEEWTQVLTKGQGPSEGRRSHSAFMYNGLMYIFGGYNGLTNLHFNDVYSYNPGSFEWKKMSVMGLTGPSPRRRPACVQMESQVFIFGGTDDSDNTEASEAEEIVLTAYDDLFVLDMEPSLKTLCMTKINEYNLDKSCLPRVLQQEISINWNPSTNDLSYQLNSG